MTVGTLIRARRRFHCCKCDKVLPAQRVDRYCRECRRIYQREWHRQMWQRKIRERGRREAVIMAFGRPAEIVQRETLEAAE